MANDPIARALALNVSPNAILSENEPSAILTSLSYNSATGNFVWAEKDTGGTQESVVILKNITNWATITFANLLAGDYIVYLGILYKSKTGNKGTAPNANPTDWEQLDILTNTLKLQNINEYSYTKFSDIGLVDSDFSTDTTFANAYTRIFNACSNGERPFKFTNYVTATDMPILNALMNTALQTTDNYFVMINSSFKPGSTVDSTTLASIRIHSDSQNFYYATNSGNTLGTLNLIPQTRLNPEGTKFVQINEQVITANNVETSTFNMTGAIGLGYFPANSFMVGDTYILDATGIFNSNINSDNTFRIYIGGNKVFDGTARVSTSGGENELVIVKLKMLVKADNGGGSFECRIDGTIGVTAVSGQSGDYKARFISTITTFSVDNSIDTVFDATYQILTDGTLTMVQQSVFKEEVSASFR